MALSDPSPSTSSEVARPGVPFAALASRLIWLCMLPLLALALWLAVEIVREADAQRDREAANLARNAATAIDYQLNARISALTVLAASPLLDDPALWKDLYREAQRFFRNFGSHVILADAAPPMRMRFNTRAPFGAELPLLPQPEGQAAAPIAARTQLPAVGDIFVGPLAGEPLVAIAVPARRNGTTSFLLLTIIETRQFQERLDRVAFPAGWRLSLLDGQGGLIARHRHTAPATDADPGPAARHVARSELSRWEIVVEIPAAVRRAMWLPAATALGAIILAATLLGLLGGKLAARRLGRSLASLAADGPPPALPDIAEVTEARRRLLETAQRQTTTEAVLRENEAKLRLFIEHAPAALAMFDRRMRYLAASRRWRADYDLGDIELTGRSHYEIFPELPEKWKTAHCRGLDGEVVRVDEDSFPRPDGRVQWLRWEVRPWQTAEGRVGGIVIFTEDISERKRAEEELQRSRHMLQQYAAHLQTTIESERMRIARELHDDIGQRLSALKMDLGWVKRRLTPAQTDAAGKLDEMGELITEGVRTIKGICADLRPGVLEDLGLVAALEGAVAAFRERSGVAATLRIEGEGPTVAGSLAMAVYRIAQEALTNVARHAEAGRVEVRLRHDAARLTLEIEDDGKGLPAHADAGPHSFGIIGMRERVRAFAGDLHLGGNEDRGTLVRAVFPLFPPETPALPH